MRRLIPFAFLPIALAFSISCIVEEVERPEIHISCDMDFSSHPKNELYQSVIDEYIAKGIPGLVVLIRTPEQDSLWIGSGGYASIEDDIPVNPCHRFHAASVTKPYMSAVVLMLAEEGLIDLDAKISTYLPTSMCDRLGNGNEASVRQLANQTSGILDFNDETANMVDLFNDPTRISTIEDNFSYIYGKPGLFEPGTDWSYSDVNYILLALIVDEVTGSHVDEFYSRIIDPLGLENTFYHKSPYPEPQGLVNSYWDQFGNSRLTNVSDIQKAFCREDIGCAGLIASVYDYCVFLEALRKGELLSDGAYAEMTDWFDTGRDYSYGLGLYMYPTDYR
ncbi:beta-lactamase family protein [candidate division WOR-3 bacterium]|nr:beta-lactamase family protein [candidate division WOR-3 bacterium]